MKLKVLAVGCSITPLIISMLGCGSTVNTDTIQEESVPVPIREVEDFDDEGTRDNSITLDSVVSENEFWQKLMDAQNASSAEDLDLTDYTYDVDENTKAVVLNFSERISPLVLADTFQFQSSSGYLINVYLDDSTADLTKVYPYPLEYNQWCDPGEGAVTEDDQAPFGYSSVTNSPMLSADEAIVVAEETGYIVYNISTNTYTGYYNLDLGDQTKLAVFLGAPSRADIKEDKEELTKLLYLFEGELK